MKKILIAAVLCVMAIDCIAEVKFPKGRNVEFG